MKVLGLDTSTEACSAALYVDGEISEKYTLAPREHTKLILPMIDALMADAQLLPQQLDAIAFSRGPGSFTGVRITAGIVQGIAFGADLPVAPVSTLAAIAQDYFNQNSVGISFTAMDARMGEIFWGVYRKDEQGYARLLGEEAVTPAVDVTFPELAGAGVGTGWAAYGPELSTRLGALLLATEPEKLPRASAVVLLGADGVANRRVVPVEQAMPVYLRDKVAKKESER